MEDSPIIIIAIIAAVVSAIAAVLIVLGLLGLLAETGAFLTPDMLLALLAHL